MQLEATVRDSTGATVKLPPVVVNEGTTKDQVVQQLSQRGYQVMSLGRLPEVSTTTTPISGVSVPRAIGQTLLATGQRAFTGAQKAAEAIESGGVFQHPGTFAGNVAAASLPFVAPELVAPGMAAEAFMRTRPGTGEKEAAQAASQGQLGAAAVALPFALGKAAVAGTRALGGSVARGLRGKAAAAEPSFAGVREAQMAKSLTGELEKSGGALDQTTFAKQVRPALRRMLREAERTATKGTPAQQQAIAPTLGSLRTLVGRTVSLAPVAHAVSKDPQMLATLLREGGPEALPALQSAHMTGLISAATGKAGLARGTLDTEKLLSLWNDLGHEGQRALYGTRAPVLRRLFETIAATEPAAAAGATAAKGGSRLFQTAELLLGGAGAYEMLGGHVLRGLGIAGIPLLFGKLLLRNGGAEWLTDVATAMRDARLFAQVAPALRKTGAALLAAERPAAAPAAMAPMFAAAPAPAPAAAPAAGPLDTPEGILSAIEHTRLPRGWRPGMPPVMR